MIKCNIYQTIPRKNLLITHRFFSFGALRDHRAPPKKLKKNKNIRGTVWLKNQKKS